MADIFYDVDTALSEVPVNLLPLLDATDFKTIEDAVAYNAAGLALHWHFVTTAGAYTVTAVTPTTGGAYDWTDQGAAGIYTIEIPASGGGSINNDTEGFGWFTGVATGVLPWRGPVCGFRAAAINNSLIDGSALVVDSVTNAVGSVTGAVGSVTGSVGSVTGAVGSVTGAVGSVTGNVGGNVTGSVGSVAAGGIALATFAADAKALMGVIAFGTAQSVTGTTIRLAAAETFADDEIIGATVIIRSATTGAGQARVITDYASATDTATVDTWTTTPTGTITYIVLATPPGSSTLPITANVTQWLGTACATPTVAGVPEVDLTHVGGSTTNVAALATNVDAILTDTAVIGSTGQGLTSLATQASVNTIDGIVDSILVDTAEIGAAGAGLTALATAANLATVAGYLDTEIAAILADTNELQTDWANGGRLDLLIDAIKAKTDSLTFTVAGQVDANIQSINDVTILGAGTVGNEFAP